MKLGITWALLSTSCTHLKSMLWFWLTRHRAHHDFIHKIETIKHIQTSTEQNPATKCAKYAKFGEIWPCAFQDMRAEIQRQTSKQTNKQANKIPLLEAK